MRGVASCCIDHYGLVGEPPVAITCTTNTLQRRLAKLPGQWEIETRIDQSRSLARARRAHDDVPGQFIDEFSPPNAAVRLSLHAHGFERFGGFRKSPLQFENFVTHIRISALRFHRFFDASNAIKQQIVDMASTPE